MALHKATNHTDNPVCHSHIRLQTHLNTKILSALLTSLFGLIYRVELYQVLFSN